MTFPSFHDPMHLYFLTASIIDWKPLFTSPDYANMPLNSLAWLQQQKRILLFAFVIMPAQLHTILKPEGDTIGEIVRQFGSFTAHAILKKLRTDNQKDLLNVFHQKKRDQRHGHSIWQDIQAKNIYPMNFLQQKMEYIHQNPVAKEWKLVEDWADYLYSSAGYYDNGRKPIIEITDINEWLTSTPSPHSPFEARGERSIGDNMQYNNLGKTGMKVSRLCLGMMSYGSKQWRDWVLDEEQAKPFMKRALDAGINFFDTADVYSLGESEKVTGNLLRHFGVKRENVVVATKVNGQMSDDVNDKGLSRKHILDSIDKSLQRLQMEYVDLYQIHRWDYDTPIEETMEALHDIVKAGKARYIGASSMFAWQFAKAQHTAEKYGWSRFVSMQNHYNLVYREEEREMIPLCVDQGVGLIPWSPMARGFFAGNRKRGGGGETSRANNDPFANNLYFREEDFAVAEHATEVAKKRGVTASQIALAWVLGKPHVTSPIIGATKMDHLEQAIAALDIKLSDDEIKRLEEPYQPHPVLGHS